MLASHELRKRRQNHTQRFPVTARKLAEFLESVEAEEKLLAQRLSDMEVRRARSDFGPASENTLTSALAVVPPAEPVGEPLESYETYGEL
jgi:hypothetical protein